MRFSSPSLRRHALSQARCRHPPLASGSRRGYEVGSNDSFLTEHENCGYMIILGRCSPETKAILYSRSGRHQHRDRHKVHTIACGNSTQSMPIEPRQTCPCDSPHGQLSQIFFSVSTSIRIYHSPLVSPFRPPPGPLCPAPPSCRPLPLPWPPPASPPPHSSLPRSAAAPPSAPHSTP